MSLKQDDRRSERPSRFGRSAGKTRAEKLDLSRKNRAKKQALRERRLMQLRAEIDTRQKECELRSTAVVSVVVATETVVETPNQPHDKQMNAFKTLAKFVWAMAKIAYDCFRHPFSNTRVAY